MTSRLAAYTLAGLMALIPLEGRANFEQYYQYGLQMLQAHKPAEAAQYLQAATQLNPQSAEAFYALGLAYQQTGQTALARGAYENSLAINPNQPALVQALQSLGSSSAASGSTLERAAEGEFVVADEGLPAGYWAAPETSKFEAFKEAGPSGNSVMKLYRDPAVRWGSFGMSLLKFTKGPNQSKFFDMVKDGALVFYLKGQRGWEEFAVGFAGPKLADYNYQRFNNVLNIAKYGGVTTDWRKVIIPFSHFSGQGTLWGSYRGTESRHHERKWDWLDTEEIFFDVRRTKNPEQTFYLDRVSLVSSYDPAEVVGGGVEESTESSAGGGQLDDGTVVFFDDQVYGGSIWSWPRERTYAVLDESGPKVGKKCIRFELLTTENSGSGVNINRVDLSVLRDKGAKLEFWVRGKNGAETFGIDFVCRDQQGDRIGTGSGSDEVSLDTYTNVTKKWRKVSIPLLDFSGKGNYQDGRGESPFNWASVVDLSFHSSATGEDELVYFLDDIRVVP